MSRPLRTLMDTGPSHSFKACAELSPHPASARTGCRSGSAVEARPPTLASKGEYGTPIDHPSERPCRMAIGQDGENHPVSVKAPADWPQLLRAGAISCASFP